MIIFLFLICADIFAQRQIKQPNVSGQFYPGDKTILSNQIDNFFKNVEDDPTLKDKEILALIAPHAGYMYSGQVAAYAFKALKKRQFDAVFVLAGSHYFAFNSISVYKQGLLRTPLGDIEVEEELAKRLIEYNKKIEYIPSVFEREHSLEVELPFLQKSLDNLKIVPVIFGQIDYTDCAMFAKAIIDTAKDKKVLLVASTDLSHFYAYIKAVEKDAKTISYIKNLDSLGLWQSNLKKEAELCGINPVLVVLNYAKQLGLKPKILNYANSADATGNKSSVVGYASFVFFRDSNNNPIIKGEGDMLTDNQKKRLLEIARQSMTEYVTNSIRKDFKEVDPQLDIKRGAFVTLHKNGELRGCIGSFTSHQPLYQVIADMAIESATGDPRFRPVTKEELDKISIEISVLTEPQLIDDWKKIRLGVDGVIVKKGFSQGVFLPQVATETGWDLETFLQHLCAGKAGLSADAYKDPATQIRTFQAIIFSE